jgi:hypothetical protein
MDRFMARVRTMLVAVDETYFEYATHADYPDSDYLRRQERAGAPDLFESTAS